MRQYNVTILRQLNLRNNYGVFGSIVPCNVCPFLKLLRHLSGLSVVHYIPEIVVGGGTQLVEALHYKPEGRGFDSRWYHWNFSLT
jgi:hypothetical protein